MSAPLDLAAVGRIGFLTLPNFSMIAAANAIEAARMANYVSESPAYGWQVVTPNGEAAPASNGLTLAPTIGIADVGALDLLLVCGGVDVRHAVDRRLEDTLRRLARRGVALGALCTGTFALAEAGLLDGYRSAIHWENLSAVREEFPQVDFTEDLFVIDRDRLTCTGGIAPLDMMLAMISARLGRRIAERVSAQFIVDRVRRPDGTPPVPARLRTALSDPTLARAVRLMERSIESPLSIAEAAERLGVSTRQVERLFSRHTGQSPSAYYLGLRLDRARELLRLSPMSVTDVSMACGFQSAAHFSTAYKGRFGHSPRTERAA